SGRPSAPAVTTAIANGPSRSSISAALPGLWVATTSVSPLKRRWAFPSWPFTSSPSQACSLALQLRELADPLARERQHRGELGIAEHRALGGRLHLDDAPLPGQHEIGIGVGARILAV